MKIFMWKEKEIGRPDDMGPNYVQPSGRTYPWSRLTDVVQLSQYELDGTTDRRSLTDNL